MRLARLSASEIHSCTDFSVAVAIGIAAIGNRIALAGREEQVAFEAMLFGVEIVIAAVHDVELLVRATLQDFTLLYHQNLVGAADGRKDRKSTRLNSSHIPLSR